MQLPGSRLRLVRSIFFVAVAGVMGVGIAGWVPDLAQSYPYLVLCLLLAVPASIGYWCCRSHREPMLMSSLLSAPCAVYAIVFVPEYWQPEQLFHFGLGPEDVLFSLANGATAWLFVAAPWRPVGQQATGREVLRRFGRASILFNGLMLLPWLLLGVPIMTAGLAAATVLLAALLWRRRDRWRMAVRGAAGFLGVYTLCLICVVSWNPAFLEQWSAHALRGPTVLGLPYLELAWALAFGAVWPVLVSDVLRLKLAPRREEQRARKQVTALLGVRSGIPDER